MTLSWWIVKPEIYQQAIADIRQYPGLRYHIENNKFIICGSFGVFKKLEEGFFFEDFLIKIVFPDNYPDDLPKVYETGGRIKIKNANTHFNNDESACLFYPTEKYLYFSENKTSQLKEFLDGPVKSFFFSQIYYIYHNKWPFGQRSHNIKGLLEFYGENLDIPCDQVSILKALSYLLKTHIKGHWACPCGNEKIRKCHIEKFRFLNDKIPKKIIKQEMNLLEKQLV